MNTSWGYSTILLALFITAQTASASLVLHLEFEEDFTDSSGLGNNAVIDTRSSASSTVTTVASGIDGSALSISGGLGWLAVANSTSLSPSAALTMSAWVNPTGRIGNNSGVFFKGELVGAQPDWQIVINDVGTGGLAGGSGAVTSINGNGFATSDALVVDYAVKNPIPNGEWTHIASTYDGNILKLFVDGVLVGSQNHIATLDTSGSPLYIGNRFRPAGDVGGFLGLMDELRVYDTALTEAEISSLASLDDSNGVSAPATFALIGLGLAGIGYGRRKQIKAS